MWLSAKYDQHNKNLCPIQGNKIILILLMMFPSINTLNTLALTFTQQREHCQCKNCELGHLGWNTVYMMAFHTEDILKAVIYGNFIWIG